MKASSKAKAQSAGQIWPKTLEHGGTWSLDSMVERDFTFEAKCRCVSPDLTLGISICSEGCGDPTTVCTTDFGCGWDERGCNANQCTCLPFDYDGIENNFMTYEQCYDQCAAVDMVIPSTEEGVLAASNTGCNTNGFVMWVGVAGAYELPETYAACTDDNTIVDSQGDSCADWYVEKPETCGDYDTDEFIASSACCACKWMVLSTDAETFTPTQDYFQDLATENFAILFTKDNCHFCHESVNYLSSVGYSSYVIDIDTLSNRAETVAWLQNEVGNSMVPAIFINKVFIGGYTQLK